MEIVIKTKQMAWVLVNSNSAKEARTIGQAILKKRLAACYSLAAKLESGYFWPPKSNKLEYSKGPMLILDTLPRHYPQIVKLVRKLHSDKVPFIGKVVIDQVNPDFYNWLKGELKS